MSPVQPRAKRKSLAPSSLPPFPTLPSPPLPSREGPEWNWFTSPGEDLFSFFRQQKSAKKAKKKRAKSGEASFHRSDSRGVSRRREGRSSRKTERVTLGFAKKIRGKYRFRGDFLRLTRHTAESERQRQSERLFFAAAVTISFPFSISLQATTTNIRHEEEKKEK